jgi:hypothetical protein
MFKFLKLLNQMSIIVSMFSTIDQMSIIVYVFWVVKKYYKKQIK